MLVATSQRLFPAGLNFHCQKSAVQASLEAEQRDHTNGSDLSCAWRKAELPEKGAQELLNMHTGE